MRGETIREQLQRRAWEVFAHERDAFGFLGLDDEDQWLNMLGDVGDAELAALVDQLENFTRGQVKQVEATIGLVALAAAYRNIMRLALMKASDGDADGAASILRRALKET